MPSSSRRDILATCLSIATIGLAGCTTGLLDRREKWHYSTVKHPFTTPSINADHVYAACNDGKLYAFAASDGSVQWRYTFDETAYSPTVALADGTLYYSDFGYDSDNKGTVHAIEAASGDQLWQTSLDSLLYTPTIIEEGVVYVGGTGETALYALDAKTGDHRTAFDPAPGGVATLSIADGVAYTGDSEGYVSAFDLETGTKRWSYDTNDNIDGSQPAVAHGRVYVGNTAGKLFAIDIETGNLDWQFDTGPSPVFASPTIVDETVYIGGGGTYFYALDTADGDRQWQFAGEGGVVNGAVVADNTVYVADALKYLYALETGTGDKRWQHELDTTAFNPPALSSDSIYVSTGWSLYAIKR